jgi:hypothetical protein
MATDTELDGSASPPRFSRGVAGIGISSFLADVGHEIPTALLPSLLIVTLHAPASALGLIEGISDAAADVARLAGGALADDPGRRRRVAVGGYTTAAVLSAAIGAPAAPLASRDPAGRSLGSPRATGPGAQRPARRHRAARRIRRPTGSSAQWTNSAPSAAHYLSSGWLPRRRPCSHRAVGHPGLLAAIAIIYAIRHMTAARQRTSQPTSRREAQGRLPTPPADERHGQGAPHPFHQQRSIRAA